MEYLKKTTALIILLIVSNFAIAQEQSDAEHRDIRKNDISINPNNLIVFAAFDISYERILTQNISVGIDLFALISDKNEDQNNIDNVDDFFDIRNIFDKETAITGQVKYFFGNRMGRGFYMEAFGMWSSGSTEKETSFTDNQGFIRFQDVEVPYKDIAVGFGVGGKFVSRKGFFLDIGFGLGRNLFSPNSPSIVVRPDLYLGYRF